MAETYKWIIQEERLACSDKFASKLFYQPELMEGIQVRSDGIYMTHDRITERIINYVPDFPWHLLKIERWEIYESKNFIDIFFKSRNRNVLYAPAWNSSC